MLGVLLTTIQLEKKCIVALGWTDDERVACVLRDGTALLYNVQGEPLTTFPLNDSTRYVDEIILHAVVWKAGIVALSSHMVVHVCDGLGISPNVYSLNTSLASIHPPTSMVVLLPEFTSSGKLEVILATANSSLVVVDRNGCEDQLLQERLAAPVLDMVAAPNGRFIACFTASGILTVLSTSFTTKVLDFDTATTSKPCQMEWCGEDSIMLHWSNVLLIIGPYGHWLKFPYKTPLHIVPESDCCRILTHRTCEVLQRVPAPVETIHRIGSTDLAAMLFDAMEAFDDADPKADENIRYVQPRVQIVHAIHTCVFAAAVEILPSQQKRYLRAAAYGKSFCQVGDFVADGFVDVCRALRIINNLRCPDPGVWLTWSQYEVVMPSSLVNRLLARHKHALALSILQHLSIRHDLVLVHWACVKLNKKIVQVDMDETLRDMIRSRLVYYRHGVSYIQVAATADRLDRRRLATMLLDYDVQASQQLKLLLRMDEYELALQKAVNSFDVDATHLVLNRLLAKCTKPTLRNGSGQQAALTPPAAEICRLACVAHGANFDFPGLTQDPSHTSYPNDWNMLISAAYQQPMINSRLERLQQAIELPGSHGMDSQFAPRLTDGHITLLRLQIELEARFGLGCFLDMSLLETLYNLFALGASQPSNVNALQYEAHQLSRQFKVPDRCYYYVKIRSLAASGQRELLRSFADERKPPVGYLPFVRAGLEFGHPVLEVAMYVGRLASAEARFEYYVHLKMWQRAAETAFRSRDSDRLGQIRSACDDEAAIALVDQLLAKL